MWTSLRLSFGLLFLRHILPFTATQDDSMIAFEVLLNGERLCLAGAGNVGVVTAILHWVRRKPLQEGLVISDWEEEELKLDVAGIDSLTNEHLAWLKRRVEIGDEITLRIIEINTVDEPEGRSPMPQPLQRK